MKYMIRTLAAVILVCLVSAVPQSVVTCPQADIDDPKQGMDRIKQELIFKSTNVMNMFVAHSSFAPVSSWFDFTFAFQ